MITWILLSTIFLTVFLVLRAIFVNKINIRVMFVLWILVAVRLLVPTYIPIQAESYTQYSISSLTSHILNLDETIPYIWADNGIFNNSNDTQNMISVSEDSQAESNRINNTNMSGNRADALEDNNQIITNSSDQNRVGNGSYDAFVMENENDILLYILNHPWQFIWLLGMLVVASSMIVSNLKWYQHLKRYRTPLNTITDQFDSPVPVYYVKSLKSPCLVGFFRPCIYVNDQIFDDDKGYYIIRHELTHYKRKDFIWMLIQMICVCVHWFNPLVWYAAFLFRRDNECACDAVAVEDFTSEDRILYGRLLLNTAAAKYDLSDVLTTATSMSMEGKTLKKRIHIILHKASKRIGGSILAVVIAIIFFFGAITGSADMNASIWSGSYVIENFEASERTIWTFKKDNLMVESKFGYYRFETIDGENTIILSPEKGGEGFDVRDFTEGYAFKKLANNKEYVLDTYSIVTETIGDKEYCTRYRFTPNGTYEVCVETPYKVIGNKITIRSNVFKFSKNNPEKGQLLLKYVGNENGTLTNNMQFILSENIELILSPLEKNFENEFYSVDGNDNHIIAFLPDSSVYTFEKGTYSFDNSGEESVLILSAPLQEERYYVQDATSEGTVTLASDIETLELDSQNASSNGFLTCDGPFTDTYKEIHSNATFQFKEDGTYIKTRNYEYYVSNETLTVSDGPHEPHCYTYTCDEKIGALNIRYEGAPHVSFYLQRIDNFDENDLLEWRNDHEILFE